MLMYLQITFLVLFDVCRITYGDNLTASGNQRDITINDLSNRLLNLIGVHTESNNESRILELKDKLKQISQYVIDKELVEKIVKSAAGETDLNETNFFKALNDNDHIQFLDEKEPKNLYLKLKQKINRDDILKILKDRESKFSVLESGRKAMDNDYFGRNDEELVDDVVDKLIAEHPQDHHNYEIKANDSIYWDPQNELEDLKEYHRHDGRRIYKGERTLIRNYPFMVSVHVMGRFWCGGVIYWHDLVLTSASCLQLMHNNRFFRENAKVLQIRVGSNHSRIGGEMIDALEVYFHPSYNPRSLKHNIAVIRLRRHLYFNYHRIPKVIAISHSRNSLPSTAEVMLLGWGVTKMSQKMSYEPIFLQRKFLPIYPNTFCKEVYGDKFVSSTMFCAGTVTTGEGACDHDAGGPAVLAGTLVGIISFGPSVCGYPDAPTVFTLVGAYADWIEKVNETMPGYYRGKKRTTISTRSPMLDFFQTYRIRETTSPDPISPLMQLSTLAHSPLDEIHQTPAALREGADDWSLEMEK